MSALKELARELSGEITREVMIGVRREIISISKTGLTVCYSEEEAAAKLNCSPQTLARRRKSGEIDYSLSPSGKPVYMVHHLLDYLLRNERRNGKQQVTLTDVLGGKVLEFPARKAA